MEEKKPSPQYAYYLRNKDRVHQQKREKYSSDTAYAEEKRKKALERYYKLKGARSKTDEA